MPIANIPFLGGYTEQTQLNQQRGMDQLQQAGSMLTLRNQEMERQRNLAFQAEIDALPPDQRTTENIVKIGSKYAPAKDLFHYGLQSQDTAAKIKATNEQAMARLSQGWQQFQMNYSQRQRDLDMREKQGEDRTQIARERMALEQSAEAFKQSQQAEATRLGGAQAGYNFGYLPGATISPTVTPQAPQAQVNTQGIPQFPGPAVRVQGEGQWNPEGPTQADLAKYMAARQASGINPVGPPMQAQGAQSTPAPSPVPAPAPQGVPGARKPPGMPDTTWAQIQTLTSPKRKEEEIQKWINSQSAMKELSPFEKKEIADTDDAINSAKRGIGVLESIIKVDPKTGRSQNDIAFEGGTAGMRATASTFLPKKLGGESEGAKAAIDIQNKVIGQALEQLKTIFGGMPTEGERKILIELQGSINLKASERQKIYERAIEMAKSRLEQNEQKARQMRSGTYFKQGGGPTAPAAGPKFLGFEEPQSQ